MFLNWKYEDLGVSVTLWISISCVIQGIGPGEFKQTPHAGSARLSDEWGNFSRYLVVPAARRAWRVRRWVIWGAPSSRQSFWLRNPHQGPMELPEHQCQQWQWQSTENRQKSQGERNFAKASLAVLASLLGLKGEPPSRLEGRNCLRWGLDECVAGRGHHAGEACKDLRYP